MTSDHLNGGRLNRFAAWMLRDDHRIVWRFAACFGALFVLFTDALRAQSTPSAADCLPVPRDSAAMVADTVFRNCGVQEPARLRRTVRPSFAFREQYPCASVELEFVVGSDGRPVAASARVIRTTSDAFAGQVVRSLARWRYTPGRRGGRAVSQLVRVRYTLADGPQETKPAEATRWSRRDPDPCR